MNNICQYYLVDSNNTQCIFASIIIFLRKYIIKLYSQEMKDETNERDLPTKIKALKALMFFFRSSSECMKT